jgi:threonine synthase
MRFVSTRGGGRPVSLRTALFEGMAEDGGLYMPESIEAWSAADLAALPGQSLIETGISVLRPFVADDIPSRTLSSIVDEALAFPIPLVEIEAGLFALELFHGPTLAFKDVGARVLAGLMAALHGGDARSTILVATSGDTGSAVGHAFSGIDGFRVVVLYPDRGVSPTQEAQLTMFNHVEGANVRAYAVAGTFDDCQGLVKRAFADRQLRQAVRLTSANSINVGRLLPQMIYYFCSAASRAFTVRPASIFSVPSGNFGNLAAGVMARRAGAPIRSFVAATNVNDVVPRYLATGRFEPRPSIQTIANAMDCGNPSNFERLRWLHGGGLDAIRGAVEGSVHAEDDVRSTILRVYDERNYLLDPHSAIAYLGARSALSRSPTAVFLATAHAAKFAEVVEPIIGRTVDVPARLAAALAAPRSILRLEATLDAVAGALRG